MKPLPRFVFLSILAVSVPFIISAQDGNQSLGDYSRQLRARKEARDDAREIDGLKEANFHANILITDSNAEIEKWVLLPAESRAGAGRFREVTAGKKLLLPIVVSDYPYAASEKMFLSAHIRFTSPAGKTLFDAPGFATSIKPDPKSPNTIVLNPVMDVTFDAKDIPGMYTLHVTVIDQVHSVYSKAEEHVQLNQAASPDTK